MSSSPFLSRQASGGPGPPSTANEESRGVGGGGASPWLARHLPARPCRRCICIFRGPEEVHVHSCPDGIRRRPWTIIRKSPQRNLARIHAPVLRGRPARRLRAHRILADPALRAAGRSLAPGRRRPTAQPRGPKHTVNKSTNQATAATSADQATGTPRTTAAASPCPQHILGRYGAPQVTTSVTLASMSERQLTRCTPQPRGAPGLRMAAIHRRRSS